MPRWMRIARGMIGTGFTFACGLGGLTAAVATLGWAFGEVLPVEIAQLTGRVSVVAFILGVAFSGALALVARRRAFSALSVPLVAAMGGGAGVLYFLFCLIPSGYRAWTPALALGNFVLLVSLGTSAAVGTLLVARRARGQLDEDQLLDQQPTPALTAGAAHEIPVNVQSFSPTSSRTPT